MAQIFDNKSRETSFETALNERLFDGDVKRVDFCVGYFNLRGWDLVMDQIDTLQGEFVDECDGRYQRYCRLLVGMLQIPKDIISRYYGANEDFVVDNQYKESCRVQMAQEFRKQLLLGLPTKRDKFTLQRLLQQLKDGKVCIKLYTGIPVHAKLYISHYEGNRSNCYSLMGSSNLTGPGLTRKGELNIEITDNDQNNGLCDWFTDL